MTAPSIEAGAGPLTRRVLEYEQVMKGLVAGAADGPVDWSALAAFVAVEDFERVGTFLEVQDWGGYTAMLDRWASATVRFDTTVRRITEVGNLVYFEIEERHRRGEHTHVVNSLTVFAFDDDQRIVHLDVYLQQAARG